MLTRRIKNISTRFARSKALGSTQRKHNERTLQNRTGTVQSMKCQVGILNADIIYPSPSRYDSSNANASHTEFRFKLIWSVYVYPWTPLKCNTKIHQKNSRLSLSKYAHMYHNSTRHCVNSRFRYSSPPQSRNRLAACSGVISRCGSAIISYPTKNFRTVALRSNGG